MSVLVLLARLGLVAVFTVAAVAKVSDPGSFGETLNRFRVPGRSVATWAIPLAELAVAGLLLVPDSVRFGAGAALVLLGVFTATVVATLRRGEQPDCGCFGAASRAPIGPGTLARNAALAALGVLVLLEGAGAPPRGPSLWIVLLVVLVAAQGWLVRQLFLRNGRLLERIGALEREAA
jgi:uncharacterized membrane protein YphA (DoxX/SURF4 family)